MNYQQWRKKAIADGRICPECHNPVSKEQWKRMNYKGKIFPCWSCLYVHWRTGPIGSHGSSKRDNQDREGLDRIRGR